MLNTSDYSQNILYFLNTRKYPQMPADIDKYPRIPANTRNTRTFTISSVESDNDFEL